MWEAKEFLSIINHIANQYCLLSIYVAILLEIIHIRNEFD